MYTCNCRTFSSSDSIYINIYWPHIFFSINCSLTVFSAGSERSQTQPGQLDPADADIYLDALWGPLFFKHERIQRERDPLPRFSDYRMICLFLLLNLTLQLGIAFKIYQLSLGVSDQVQQTLFDGACWRVSSKQSLFGVPCLDFLWDIGSVQTICIAPPKNGLRNEMDMIWSSSAHIGKRQKQSRGSGSVSPVSTGILWLWLCGADGHSFHASWEIGPWPKWLLVSFWSWSSWADSAKTRQPYGFKFFWGDASNGKVRFQAPDWFQEQYQAIAASGHGFLQTIPSQYWDVLTYRSQFMWKPGGSRKARSHLAGNTWRARTGRCMSRKLQLILYQAFWRGLWMDSLQELSILWWFNLWTPARCQLCNVRRSVHLWRRARFNSWHDLCVVSGVATFHLGHAYARRISGHLQPDVCVVVYHECQRLRSYVWIHWWWQAIRATAPQATQVFCNHLYRTSQTVDCSCHSGGGHPFLDSH